METKRVRDRVSELRYSSLEAFLRERQGCTYIELANELGGSVSAIDIRKCQFEDALRAGDVRSAALDSLVRTINWQSRRGWGNGHHWDFRCAGIIGDWITMLQLDVANEAVVSHAHEVWEILLELSPPIGWRPKSNSDPLIKAAFDSAWPNKSG